MAMSSSSVARYEVLWDEKFLAGVTLTGNRLATPRGQTVHATAVRSDRYTGVRFPRILAMLAAALIESPD